MTQFGVRMSKLIAALALAACLAGCASRNPQVYARRDPAFFPSATNRITIGQHRQARPEDAALGTALTAELTRRGFNLTSRADAEYVLAYWIEENWSTMRSSGGISYGDRGPVGVTTYEGSPISAPGTLTVGVSSDGRQERYLLNQGIRLELYPQGKLPNGNLTAAWAGSIASGSTVKPANVPALLRALLEHFGQDFSGRVKLDEAAR